MTHEAKWLRDENLILMRRIHQLQIERDIRIWNRKMYISRPILTKEDKMIKAFRRWYSQFYSESSPRHYFARSDKNQNKLDF